MKRLDRIGVRILLAAALTALLLPRGAAAQAKPKAPATYPNFPSEMPATVQPATPGFDYARRVVEIPMRDGVKLHTVILVPKGAKGSPILLTRTPYDANALTTHLHSSNLGTDALRLRQRDRRHRGRRLHPGRPGRSGKVRLGRRLRDEPAASRPAEPDAGRSLDRHLGHDRLAREKRSRVERPRGHHRDFLRRVYAAHGARQAAPRAEGAPCR